MLISSRPPRLVLPRLDASKRSFHCLHTISRRPRATTTTNVAVTEQVWRAPNRGKRTQTAFNFQESRSTSVPVDSREKESSVASDLHEPFQYPAPLPPIRPGHEIPSYPTVILQAQNNMRKFENCVLLTRVGGFYEMYFEHAEQYGPQLNLKVGEKKTVAGPVPMVCAFNTLPKPC